MLMRTSANRSTLDDAYDAGSPRERNHSVTNSGVIDLQNLWLALRWNIRLIATVTLATVIVAAAVLVLLPPKYKATTVVLIDPRQPRVTNSEAVLSGIGSDAAAVESQVELIESSALAKKVIASLDLANDPEINSASMIERVSRGLLFLVGHDHAGAPEREANRLVYRFQSGLSVRRRGLTYILEISYSAKDPQKATTISNAVAEAYLEDQRAAKSGITDRASGWLGDRIEEMRDRVRLSERAVAEYRASNNSVDVTQGNKLINKQVEDLTQQLTLARSRTADARARLTQVEAAKQSGGAALNEALQSPVIASLRAQYAQAAGLESEYRALYGERHPTLVGARAQVAAVQRQLDNEITRILTGVRNDYEVASSREATLERDLNKLKAESSDLGRADVKLRELEREAQANRALFEQYLARAKETNEQRSLQIADARIVSPALVPIKPDRPTAVFLLLAATGFGFILSLGLVMLIEQMRRGFHSPGEIEEFLSLPSIGSLPQFNDPTPAQHVVQNPSSPYSGNLRAVRARLRHSRTTQRGDILAVVSALPGEGKSTFACNFALTSAIGGARTLLIDGDLYTRSVSKAFDLSGPGLWELLQGVPFKNVLTIDRTGLHVMGASAPANTTGRIEDINKARLEAFLLACRDTYDLIVIDTPAILPMAGNMPFVECAERAVLVAEWGKTERQATAEAIDLLGADGRHKVAGVVLNKVAVEWYRLFESGRYLHYRSYAYARPQ